MSLDFIVMFYFDGEGVRLPLSWSYGNENGLLETALSHQRLLVCGLFTLHLGSWNVILGSGLLHDGTWVFSVEIAWRLGRGFELGIPTLRDHYMGVLFQCRITSSLQCIRYCKNRDENLTVTRTKQAEQEPERQPYPEARLSPSAYPSIPNEPSRRHKAPFTKYLSLNTL